MLVRLDNHAIDEFYPWLLDNFPADEVKPLPWIKRMLARGDYSLFAWQEDNPLALAFFYHGQSEEEPALLDYLLVHPEAQSQGIGSKLLSTLFSGARAFGSGGKSRGSITASKAPCLLSKP